MREGFLPFAQPMIGDEEIAEVIDTLRSDWITTGPKVKAFERAFAEEVGAEDALALSSCTAALHVALVASGVGPGDMVVTTPMTFCSTVNVIEHVGATPIFVDVAPDTLNLDPEAVAARLDDPTLGAQGPLRAILPVHFAGHPCDLDAIDAVAAAHGAVVIEDAAHALPARYDGRSIGGAWPGGPPRVAAFSFYAIKNMTTAEGGMLTGPSELVNEARLWSLHGMSKDAWRRYEGAASWFYEVVRPGFKYNMTDIQAALGLHQLRRLEGFHRRRQAIVERYNAAFGAMPELEVPTPRTGVDPAWHLFVLRLRLEELAVTRNEFIEELRRCNIGTSVHFIPVHLHPWYRDRYGFDPLDFPVAYGEYQRCVSLPLHPRMTDDDVDDVIEAVKGAVRVKARA